MRGSFLMLVLVSVLSSACKPVTEEEKRRQEMHRGAEAGNDLDQFMLGKEYHYNPEILNFEKAHYWYNKSAAQGNVHSQYALGRMYIKGEGVPVNYDKAVEWFLKAYVKGDRFAAYHLGWLIGNGKGVQNRDYEMACSMFKYAGDEWLYLDLWTEVDETNWYLEAAEKNVAVAQYICGKRTESLDFRKACSFYRQAAEKGHPKALKRLGEIYYNGAEGTPKNFAEAIKWWSILGEQGDREIQTKVGQMLSKGEGVPVSLEKAQAWFLKAAMKGYAPAQIRLGSLWEDAVSAEVNPKAYSYAWYNLAASYSRDNGEISEAMVGRNKVESKMNPSEVNTAQQLSAEWSKQIIQNIKDNENAKPSEGK